MQLKPLTASQSTAPAIQRHPLFCEPVSAGFPSPADDYVEQQLDLNEHLIRHPAATFFLKVEGDSMRDANIRHGDVLIVDRAVEARDGKIVIAALNGELTVKKIRYKTGRTFLFAENASYHPIEITPDSECRIWGVVTFVIHRV